jgi:hypothetical protein
MQKTSARRFSWPVFTPSFIYLRSSLPNLGLTFNISFDALLKPCWDDDKVGLGWQSIPLDESEYDAMGFVDVPELFEVPSEADRAYVAQHCEERRREVVWRDMLRGLLYESKEHGRKLAICYVFKELELLRVMAEEHYTTFERVRTERMGV